MTWKQVGLEQGLNQSRIKTYLRCPKQYEFAYVKGIKNPPNLKMVVGTAVHKGIEVNYEQKLKSKKDMAESDMKDAARDELSVALKRDQMKVNKVEKGKLTDEVVIMTGSYRNEAAPLFQPVLKPEQFFEVKIPRAKMTFFGTIDLIANYAKKGWKLVVSDSKTTRRAYSQKRADIDLQLTSYLYGLTKITALKPLYVLFDTVVLTGQKAFAQQLVATRTKESLLRFEDTFRMVEKGIEHGVFPATDNEQTCSWCGYRNICHKGKSWAT